MPVFLEVMKCCDFFVRAQNPFLCYLTRHCRASVCCGMLIFKAVMGMGLEALVLVHTCVLLKCEDEVGRDGLG